MTLIKGIAIGMPVGAIIASVAIWRAESKRLTNRGYQPKDNIDPDKAKPPEGVGSAMQCSDDGT